MKFLENHLLLEHNSLRLPAQAKWFCEVDDAESVKEALAFAQAQKVGLLPIGEGTNLLLLGEVNALVMRNRIAGIHLKDDQVWVGGGENWHALVVKMVARSLFGIENLALIPGTAGAAPVQNIGAYGVELADSLVSVDAIDMRSHEALTLTRAECEFGYRDSRFKREPFWFITGITLALSAHRKTVDTYPGIKRYLSEHGLAPAGDTVFEAVTAIRREKLPDPEKMPNVGSFFKNPVLPETLVVRLKARYSDMPTFDSDQGVKVSAAWLIESAGLKGHSVGGFMVSPQHALVIVNEGHVLGEPGSSKDLQQLVDDIRREIDRRYGVTLEVEPRSYPYSI